MKLKYIALIFIIISFAITGERLSAQNDRPFVIGEIIQLHSSILNEDRTINVYLPQEYSPDSASTYPVIYLLDGSADEDFIHISGLVQFNSFPWIQRIPPTIVVGIANNNRRRDFTHQVPNLDFLSAMGYSTKDFENYGGSESFILFIQNELQPYIRSHYKTSGHNTLIGQSLGGLLASEILLKHPGMFNDYLIVSPSLWWDNGSMLSQAETLIRNIPANNISVYLGVGKEDKIMVRQAKQFVKILRKGDHAIAEVVYDYLPDEDHGTILHQAIANSFKAMHTPVK